MTAAIATLAAAACASLEHQVQAELTRPDLNGVRWGMFVSTIEGDEVAAINADSRFIPGSNTKLFTVAAAYEHMKALDEADIAAGASLRLEPRPDGAPPDLVLYGGGDATLSSAADCASNCLGLLASALKTQGVMAVSDVVGDDTLFPDERWGPGWSWNNMATRSGTAISALSIDDNELAVEVRGAETLGGAPTAAWVGGDPGYPLVVDAVTTSGLPTDLRVERRPGSSAVRVFGRIAAGDAQTVRIGVEDPAELSARRLKGLLTAAGVEVRGATRIRHRPERLADDPDSGSDAQPEPLPPGVEVARLTPGPLGEDLARINKVSQNLHAELVLRRLGLLDGGTGSSGHGLKKIAETAASAGIDPVDWDLFDGSGMSTYNRLTPRAVVQLLLWSQTRPWGEAFRNTLPIGGVDGSLARRFVGTPLQGKIFAKTGTLSGVNALSGFLIARSGRTLVFSIMANDRPTEAGGALPAMDAALLRIAAAN
jgi:serine-type D-Ala-D-Ala carboxypeptidase/endopeptidase (penicillin-binding protein 4)